MPPTIGERVGMSTHITPGTSLSDHYASLRAAQATSGLRMQHFAALHGVSACTLYQWRRRLSPTEPVATSSGPHLVAVDVVGSHRPSPVVLDDGFEVRLPNGLHLRLPTNFVASRVAELVTTLRAG